MSDVLVLKIQFEQIESNSGVHTRFLPRVASLVARCFCETGFENTWKEKKTQSLVSLRAKSSGRNRSVHEAARNHGRAGHGGHLTV